MKEKTKKILAGVGVGLALSSTMLFAGCSSNIALKQEDLDKTIRNVNNYLEEQQNNNSEIVRNSLNTLLIDGMNSSMSVNNISVKLEVSNYKHGLNMQGEDISITYKRNVDNNSIKVYYNDNNVITYVEATKKDNDVFDVEEFGINATAEKTYNKKTDVNDISSIILNDQIFSDYVATYSSIVALLNYNDNLVWTDFVRSSENGIDTFKCIAQYKNEGDMGLEMVSNWVLQFKNEKIIKMETTDVIFESNGVICTDGYRKTVYTFDYENETINFDKTGFDTSVNTNE